MLTLLLGDTTQNREKLVELLCEKLKSEDPKIKYIVKEPLLRTKIQDRLAEKGVVALAPNPILTRDVIFRSKEKPLHPALRNIYLLKTIEQENKNLELLGELSSGGLVSSLSSFFKDLRTAKISPSSFRKSLRGKLDTAKNRDLSLLYETYTELIQGKGFKEAEDVLWETISDLKFSLDETIILDGFYNLDPFDIALIQKLIASKVKLYINYPYVSESFAFEALEAGYRFLKDKADKIEVSTLREVKDVKVVKAQTPKQEAEYVLKTIKKLFWENKINHTDDVVIFSNNLKRYRPLFSRACIAEELDFRQGPVSLNQTAVVKELNTLIAFLSRPLEKEEFRTLLLSKYFNFGGFLNDISQVDTAALLNKVRLNGTSDSWRIRLKSLQKTSKEANELLDSLQLLDELSKLGQKKLKARELAELFLQLLERLKVYDNLFLSKSFDPYQVLELRAFVEAKDHLVNLAEQVENEVFIVSDFLKSWIYSLGYSHLTVAQDGISVHDISEAPLLKAKFAFIVGLSEGDFPVKVHEPWSFEDEERELLNQGSLYQLPLSSNREKLQDYLYWESLRCSSTVFLLSPAESNGVFKEESRYIDELQEFGLEKPYEELEIEPLITSENEYLEAFVQIPENLDTLPQRLKESIQNYQQNGALKHTFPDLGYMKDAYKRTLSVTSFDEYLDCPYRFFVHNQLKLREEEIISDEISSLDGGSIWHRVLELYYKDLIDQTPPFHFDEKKFDSIVRDVFQTINASEFYKRVELEKYYESVKNYIADDLNRSNFKVKFLEMPFGSEDKASLKVGPYVLRGKIDRVDFIYGEHEKEGYFEGFFVTDYKRSNSSLVSAKGTDCFQLVAYMSALKKLEIEPVIGGKFHALTGDEVYLNSTPSDRILGKRTIKKRTLDEFVSDIEERLNHATECANALYNGVYTPNYTSQSCRYCAFTDLCQRPTRKGEEDAD